MESALDLKSIIIIVHAISAAVGVGAVLVTDYIFLKFLGDFRITKKEVEVMKGLSEVIWLSLIGLFITGLMMVIGDTSYFSSPKFLLKMVIVTMIVLNGIVLNAFITPRLHKIAFHERHSRSNDVPDIIRKVATLSGAVSFISWLSAFVLGSVKSIPFSFAAGLGYYFAAICVLAIFAGLSRKKR